MPKQAENTLIFIAHHKKERDELQKLLTHLAVLKSKNALTIWHKSQIPAGENHQKTYDDHLKKANIALLLITADFIASSEFQNLKTKLSNQPKTKVVPILVKPSSWKEDSYLKKLQVLPKNKQTIPASSTVNTDEAYVHITSEINHLINPKSQKPKIQDYENKPVKQKQKRRILWNIIGTIAFIAGVFIAKDLKDKFFTKEEKVVAETKESVLNTKNKQTETKEEVILSDIAFRFASNDSVLNVLILRFEDYIANKETNCIGRSIETNLIELSKKMPLNPIYVDTIASPKRPEIAKKLQEKYNADVLIYGLANQIQEDCQGANICFRHFIADTIMATIEVPDTITKVKDDVNYEKISPFDIEQGKLSVNEKSMEAWLASLIALKANDEEDALAQIEKMVDVGNPNLTKAELAEQYLQRGNAYFNLKEYESAIEDYEKTIELNPENVAAYFNRGILYFEQGKYELAIKDYEKAIQLNPDFKTYNNRGVSYSTLGKYNLAIQDYTKSIELNPEDVFAYGNRGKIYDELEKNDLAIQDYTKAIELNSYSDELYFNRGNVYYELENYDLAIQDYTKSIELNPDNASTYYNRGIVYSKLEKYKLSIRDNTKSIELNPENSFAYLNRGVSYSKLGGFDLAINDYEKSIELNPDDVFAYINRGVSYSKLKKYDLAIQSYAEGINLHPDNADLYFNRGHLYSELEKYDLSIKDYTKSINLNPDDYLAYNNRGMSYQRLKEYKLAIKDFNKAIELNPKDIDAKQNLRKTKRLKFFNNLKSWF